MVNDQPIIVLTSPLVCAIITDMLSGIEVLVFFSLSQSRRDETIQIDPTSQGQLVPKLAPVSAGDWILVSFFYR